MSYRLLIGIATAPPHALALAPVIFGEPPQKEGKKKMRQFGKVEIPQEAFIAALKMDD